MDVNLIEKVESQRLELESNLARLRKALHHWTTLELDYEGLKDEFHMLRGATTKDECLHAAHSFGPQTVDEKELKELIEPTPGKVRSSSQLVEVLSKRIDYVFRNAETLKKQISDLEMKRNALLLAAHPEHEAEADLPIAEITEMLDDEDNVISSKVQQQGDTAKKVLNVLDKTKEAQSRPAQPSILSGSRIEEVSDSDEDTRSTEIRDLDEEDTMSIEAGMDDISKSGPRKQAGYPSNPKDTEEEAEMRQEMINYGLEEVGNIVAELEMTDGGNENIEEDEEMADDFEDDEDYSYDSTEDDPEDDSGRSKAALHDEKYRKRMEELQKQLGFRMENIGPSLDSNSEQELKTHIDYLRDSEFKEHVEHLPPELRRQFIRPTAAEAARKAAIEREKANRHAPKENDRDESRPKKRSQKKTVAFAPALDIAPDPKSPKSSTMSDNIIEKTGAEEQNTSPRKPPGISRFKATRPVQPQASLYPPPMNDRRAKPNETGPVGRTIAQDLIERHGTTASEDNLPPDSDDFDEELQKRQIAEEHHRLRNRMVHEQGGYVKGGESENWGEAYAAPKVQDEKTGEPIKISRFKAARMRP